MSRRGRRTRRIRPSVPGAAPGTLNIDPSWPAPIVRAIAYGPDGCTDEAITDPAALGELLGRWPVVWVNVDGLGNETVLRQLGAVFGIHRLALEDVVNLHQRPKVDPYEGYLFLVTRPVQEGEETEQVTLFLGRNFLLTFQERPGDCFDRVRERIRTGAGLLRSAGPDYLAYALLDAVVDSYFPVLEGIGDELDPLEEAVLADPDHETLATLHRLKRAVVHLRRSLSPHREMINALLRDSSAELLKPETAIHLRDVYDHAIRGTDLAETYRELAIDLMGTYLSRQSNRMNEVMKVLTIIATIFIPLSFIAGIYGMNFDTAVSPWNLPELGWYWGYPFSLVLMGATALGLVVFFWRRGWFR
jgi:magnesium transporter